MLVVACGLGLAWFVGRTFVDREPRQYRLDFGAAQWIEVPAGKAAYFRGSLYVDGPVAAGWIQLAATGYYELYVNDVLMARRLYPCVRLSDVYDLKQILSQGKNVIALYVEAGQFPGVPQILVRSSYTIKGALARELVSDSSWKVSPIPTGIVNSYPWSSAYLDDTLWPNAKLARADEYFSTVQPLGFDPAVIEERPRARWIGASLASGGQASFRYQFDLARGREDTWLQVAATGAYDVLVNGHLVVTQPTAVRAALTGPQAPVFIEPRTMLTKASEPAVVQPQDPVTGSETPAFVMPSVTTSRPRFAAEVLPRLSTPPSTSATTGQTAGMPELAAISPSLEPPSAQMLPYPGQLGVAVGAPVLVAYDITNWVRTGINSIVIRVRTEDEPALLLAQGHANGPAGQIIEFHTDGRWRSTIYSLSRAGRWQSPIVMGGYDDPPWGPLPQTVAFAQYVPGQEVQIAIRWAAVIVLVLAAVMVVWIAAAPLAAAVTGCTLEQVWACDASLHLPVFGVAALLWLSCYDVRLPADWCYTPRITFVLLALAILSKLPLLLARPLPEGVTIRRRVFRGDHASRYAAAGVLGAIIGLGFAVRAAGLLHDSLAQDETNLVHYSWGIMKWGVPYVINGSYIKILATYELVTYPLALSTVIFGHNAFAYRLPSLLFGTATIGLIGYVGYRMMGLRAGLLAALIYAFLPAPILWARDGFYPSQECFFFLLTSWLFYETIRGPLNHRYLTLTSIAFILAYLSWEGAGFLLPALPVVILVQKWGEFDWITDRHLWCCLLVVSAIVLIQLCFRQLVLVPDFLGEVYDLSEVTTPAPVFLERLVFDPFYYVYTLLFAENHFVLSLLALGGLIFARRAPVRYLVTLLATLGVLYTCLFPRYAPRYCFSLIPILVLAGVGVFVAAIDAVLDLQRRAAVTGTRGLLLGGEALACAVLVLSANPFALKSFRLSTEAEQPMYFARLGADFKPDYRAADFFVYRSMRPGDVVIAVTTHVYELYTGTPANYSINTMLSRRMIYDQYNGIPVLTDKWTGSPAVRSLDDLIEVRSRAPRIWLIVEPPNPEALSSPVVTYAREYGRVVFEASQQQVILLPGASGPPS